MTVRKKILSFIPWAITAAALYWAFNGLDWGLLMEYLGNARASWLCLAFLLTFGSYLLRAFRWRYFFPATSMSYEDAARVLFLGFFMNNILPARTGELVRAHMGSHVTKEKRTLVLATVASERLVDGLTISLMFVGFAVGLGGDEISHNLLYVAFAFGGAALLVLLTLALREKLFSAAKALGSRYGSKTADYAVDRLETFIEGLTPLCTLSKIPSIILWSLLVWFTELGVYFCVTRAFGEALALPYCVLFLVVVNFSSLVPAAPGGIGVIEAFATKALVSLGIIKELALPMVISQHVIQYLVVGIPGLLCLLKWREQIWRFEKLSYDNG